MKPEYRCLAWWAWFVSPCYQTERPLQRDEAETRNSRWLLELDLENFRVYSGIVSYTWFSAVSITITLVKAQASQGALGSGKLHQEQGGNNNTKGVQLWLWKTRLWYAVTAGKSSFLLSVSRSSTSLTSCKTNLAGVPNVAPYGSESVRTGLADRERCIRRSVLTVVSRLRCHSSPGKDDRSTAGSASLSTKSSCVSFLVQCNTPLPY